VRAGECNSAAGDSDGTAAGADSGTDPGTASVDGQTAGDAR